jgi:hypothetical protein
VPRRKLGVEGLLQEEDVLEVWACSASSKEADTYSDSRAREVDSWFTRRDSIKRNRQRPKG